MTIETVYSGVCVLIAFIILLITEIMLIQAIKIYFEYKIIDEKKDFMKAQAERMRNKK